LRREWTKANLYCRAMNTKRWSIVFASAVAVGCQDGARVAAPRESDQPLPPIAMAPGDVIGPDPIFVPGFNDIPLPFTRTTLTLSPGVPYRVTVSGTLQFDPNPAYFACGAPNPTPLPTLVPNPVGPAGLDNFPGKYAVVVGRGTAADPPSSALNLQPRSGTAGSVTGFVDGPGVLWVSRPSVLNNACGNPSSPHNPGWTVSGSQQIQAEELPPPSITLDKARVKVGDTVRAELVIPSWVSSYFVLTGWFWVPAPGASGTARFIEGCSRTSTFCRAEVGDSGHFEVQDIGVNGVMFLTARSETIAVGVPGLRVTVTLDRDVVHPTIPSLGFHGCGKRYPEIQGDAVLLTVRGDYEDGSPAAGASVQIQTGFVEHSGGHMHPANPGFTIVGTLDAAGEYERPYGDFGVGGEEMLHVTVNDGAQEQSVDKKFRVEVGGLAMLGASGDYVLIGQRTEHPSNHWGTPSSLALQASLAKYMRLVGNHVDPTGILVLRYNDMSLTKGGLFDIDGGFVPPHFSHRQGIDVDVDDVFGLTGNPDEVSPKQVPFGVLRRVVKALRPGGAEVIVEGVAAGGSTGPHYHIRWLPCPS
jgi:hypothetical protein